MVPSIHFVVQSQMRSAIAGMKETTGFMDTSFPSAPLQDPPISGDMRETWTTLLGICKKDENPTRAEDGDGAHICALSGIVRRLSRQSRSQFCFAA